MRVAVQIQEVILRLHLQDWELRVLRVVHGEEELSSLLKPWLIMYFTKHFRICFDEGACLKSWTLTFALVCLGWTFMSMFTSGCSFKCMFTQNSYLSSFVDFYELGCSGFISAEKKTDCSALGISLHPRTVAVVLYCWLRVILFRLKTPHLFWLEIL